MKPNDLLPMPKWTIASSGMARNAKGPSVVITLPFDPKMTPKSTIAAVLMDVQTQAVRKLMAEYPGDTALPVINKLQQLVLGLNYSTHKRSLALFVSPDTEKVLYLNEHVAQQVLIDSGFRIRDLTIEPEKSIQYLILTLSGSLSRMYLGTPTGLQLIKNNEFRRMEPCTKKKNEKEPTCTDGSVCKRAHLDKFLHHMDEDLSLILNAYPLPVFVLATDMVATHFARITCNDREIAAYVHKYCPGATEEELLGLVQPYLCDWRLIRQQMALKQIDSARETGKLFAGIEEVSNAVRTRNNRLLVVERDFIDPFRSTNFTGTPEAFYIRDRVDAIVKKILEDGGKVEWVDQGQLGHLGHISLVGTCPVLRKPLWLRKKNPTSQTMP